QLPRALRIAAGGDDAPARVEEALREPEPDAPVRAGDDDGLHVRVPPRSFPRRLSRGGGRTTRAAACTGAFARTGASGVERPGELELHLLLPAPRSCSRSMRALEGIEMRSPAVWIWKRRPARGSRRGAGASPRTASSN